MPHARTNIRQRFVALLQGQTTAGDRVYDSHTYNLEHQALPAIIIFSDHEEVITETISFPRSQTRNLKVTVQCYCKATADISREIDNLALQVETLVQANSNLEGFCKDCRLESTDINLHSELEQPVAISLVFNTLYRTKEHRPDNII